MEIFVNSDFVINSVTPLLDYASPVWYLHTARDIDRLEAIQRRAACWVCGSRWNPHSHNWSKSSTSCLQDLRWPALHTRQSYFTITQVHNILHDRVSIPFNSHFKFSSTNTRSHSLSLTTSSSTINAYCFSFFNKFSISLELSTCRNFTNFQSNSFSDGTSSISAQLT